MPVRRKDLFVKLSCFRTLPVPIANIIPYGNYRHTTYRRHGNSIAIPIPNATTLKPLFPTGLGLGLNGTLCGHVQSVSSRIVVKSRITYFSEFFLCQSPTHPQPYPTPSTPNSFNTNHSIAGPPTRITTTPTLTT